MHTRKSLIVSALISTLLSSGLSAQHFKTQSVSIFKNGHSFFIKKGKVQPDNGTYSLNEADVPAALFGSLWFQSPTGNILSIKSYPDTVETIKKEMARLFHDVLAVNKGKKIVVRLSDDQSFEGIIEALEATNDPLHSGSSLVTMRTDERWITFASSQVKQIEFPDKPELMREFVEKMPKNKVEINFASAKNEQELQMMYLHNGLRWVPEYLLELTSDTKAELILQAEIANDGEDLEKIGLNLVVGIPNFRFADRVTVLLDFMPQLFPSPRGGSQQVLLSNALSSQSINYGINEDSSPGATPADPVEGSENEDFFFYQLDNFSLQKGGRAMQRLFKHPIDIAHIYEANLAENNASNNFQQDFLFSPDTDNKVFHTIRIDNKTSQPWTTGTVLIVNQDGATRPVSQDLLSYTSPAGHSFIKLTEAPDIKIQHAEKEISRAENARKFPGNTNYWYDLVKVEGKLKIRSYKKKNIDLNVRRHISGQLGESSSEWLTQEVVNRTFSPNKTTNVCWETSLKAGGELEITYTYEVFVRS